MSLGKASNGRIILKCCKGEGYGWEFIDFPCHAFIFRKIWDEAHAEHPVVLSDYACIQVGSQNCVSIIRVSKSSCVLAAPAFSLCVGQRAEERETRLGASLVTAQNSLSWGLGSK